LQGSFIIEQLTDLVEAAVYEEFDRISERGGVLGAMDTMYQRSKIQEESLYYERLKHTGELPLIGVNTFLPKDGHGEQIDKLELMRSDDQEKQAQIANVRAFQDLAADRRPAALARLQQVARDRGNVFEALMDAVKVASLGQISGALYDVGGEYRRNM
jgi:methylmalonyl-CoA mutase